MFVLSVWQRGRSKQSSNIHIPEAPLLPSHPNLLSLLCTLGHKAVHNINYNDFRINTNIGARCYNAIFLFLEHVADVRNSIQIGDFRGAPVVVIAVDEVDSNNRRLFLWTCIHRRGAKWCWDCCCWGLVQPHSTGRRCCCLSCCCWSWLESVSQLWGFSLSSGAQETLEMFLKGSYKPINIQAS